MGVKEERHTNFEYCGISFNTNKNPHFVGTGEKSHLLKFQAYAIILAAKKHNCRQSKISPLLQRLHTQYKLAYAFAFIQFDKEGI